jgi:hypothetical protein
VLGCLTVICDIQDGEGSILQWLFSRALFLGGLFSRSYSLFAGLFSRALWLIAGLFAHRLYSGWGGTMSQCTAEPSTGASRRARAGCRWCERQKIPTIIAKSPNIIEKEPNYQQKGPAKEPCQGGLQVVLQQAPHLVRRISQLPTLYIQAGLHRSGV